MERTAEITFLAAVLLAGATQSARADGRRRDEGAEESRQEPMSLRVTSLALEAEGAFEHRRVRTNPPGPFTWNTSQADRTTRIQEVARIGMEGTVGGPDILSFGGDLGLGLTQERFSETFDGRHEVDHSDGSLLEYDLRADLFRAGRVSGSVFGLQTHDRFSRPFLPSLRERRTDFGTTWTFNDDQFPMELRAEHRDTDRDGSRHDRDKERITEDVFNYAVTWNHRENHTAKFDAEFDDRDERYSGSRYRFDTQRTQLRLDDGWQFGSEHQHHLDTIVRYQEERGDLQRDLLEIGPRLTLTHSPTFSTHYQYQYSREQVGQLDVDLNRGDAGFVHQMFTNLTTTGNLFGLEERVAHDSQTRELGGNVDWAYTKNNAAGTLSADLGLTHEHAHTTGGGLRAQLRESATFRDPLPVVLYRQRVVIPSILVWNAARTRVYFPGVDYGIVPLRGRIVLYRNLLGRIGSGESVSIDYLYREDREAVVSTTRVDFRLEQQFSNGWTPYYALELRHEDRDGSIGAPLRGNDLSRHRLGIKYQKTRFAAGGELELLKDDVDPFAAYRVFAQYGILNRPTASIDGRLDFSQYFFDRRDRLSVLRRGPQRDVTLLEASLDGRTQWGTDSNGYGRIRYRYQDEHDRGITHGVDASAGAEIRWREYTLSASIEYDLLNILDSHDNGVGVWLKIRRDFSELVRR